MTQELSSGFAGYEIGAFAAIIAARAKTTNHRYRPLQQMRYFISTNAI
jgi:hypothetical protein